MRLTDIAINNLKRRKSKLLFALMGMMLGIGAMVAMYTVNTAMQTEIGNRFDQIGANIVILPEQEELGLSYAGVAAAGDVAREQWLTTAAIDKVNNIKNRENIAAIAPKLLGTGTINGKQALVVGVDFSKELRMKRWWKIYQNPQNPDAAAPYTYQVSIKPKEVLLGQLLAEELGVKPKQAVQIFGETYQVAGIIGRVGSEEDKAILMDLGTVQRQLNKPNQISLLEVSALCNTCPIEEIVAQISGQLPQARVTAIKEVVEARKQVVDGFSGFAIVLSAVMLIIGSLVAFLTMNSTVTERISEIGILRAIGFRRAHITQIILTEALIISVLSGILGYGGGMLMAKVLAPAIAQMEVTIGFEWPVALAAFGLSIFLGLVAGYLPARKASAMNPTSALRQI